MTDSLLTRLPADVESIPLMRRLLGRWLHEAGATQAQAEDLSLATSEACANAIEHAYGPGPGILEVSASVSPSGKRDWRSPGGGLQPHRPSSLQASPDTTPSRPRLTYERERGAGSP